MAVDLRLTVKNTIVSLQKEIAKKSSELNSLRQDLARYRKVQSVLDGGPNAVRIKATREFRRKRVDWNSVLKQLPGSFGVSNVAELARVRSRNYTHRFLAKWIKQRKIKRVEPGKYQKL